MSERKKRKEIEALRGFVYTGPSSAFTGMKYRSLQRRYPNEHAQLMSEKREREGR